MGNPVTWFEVLGPEAEQTAKFYSEVFGWHAQAMPEMGYSLIDTHAGRGINGGIGETQPGQDPMVTFYVQGDDPQALLDKAESLGGTTVVPVTEMEMVTFAQFRDPDGNVIGLLKGSDADGGRVSEGDGIPVDWFEVLSPDPKKAWAFYSDLFGWKIKDVSGDSFVYGEVDTGDGAGSRGGIGAAPDGRGHVNVYAGVDDLQTYLDRAESLGGKTLMPPMEVGEGTSIAMFLDAQGTWFGIYTMAR